MTESDQKTIQGLLTILDKVFKDLEAHHQSLEQSLNTLLKESRLKEERLKTIQKNVFDQLNNFVKGCTVTKLPLVENSLYDKKLTESWLPEDLWVAIKKHGYPYGIVLLNLPTRIRSDLEAHGINTIRQARAFAERGVFESISLKEGKEKEHMDPTDLASIRASLLKYDQAVKKAILFKNQDPFSSSIKSLGLPNWILGALEQSGIHNLRELLRLEDVDHFLNEQGFVSDSLANLIVKSKVYSFLYISLAAMNHDPF